MVSPEILSLLVLVFILVTVFCGTNLISIEHNGWLHIYDKSSYNNITQEKLKIIPEMIIKLHGLPYKLNHISLNTHKLWLIYKLQQSQTCTRFLLTTARRGWAWDWTSITNLFMHFCLLNHRCSKYCRYLLSRHSNKSMKRIHYSTAMWFSFWYECLQTSQILDAN